MKKTAVCVLLVLIVTLFAGCAQDPQQNTYPSYQQPALEPSNPPVIVSDPVGGLPDGYDPTSEEDTDTGYTAGSPVDSYGNTLYAGTTPIPLDPVDKPTPTPRPEKSFSYVETTASRIGVTFEAPTGWLSDDTVTDTFTITDPETLDNYQAFMSVKISPVASTYKLADVKTDVRALLTELGQYNYEDWEVTSTSARTLFKKDGYYADYRGVMYDGTIVRGRVHIALLDGNKIVTLHMSCPGWFNTSYLKIYQRFRDTAKLI